MLSSFERIATDQLEAPNPLQLNSAGALENDSDLAGELRDLIRLARERRLGRPHDADVDLRRLGDAKLQLILANSVAWRHVISLGRIDAGIVLDLLQEWLDRASADHPDRRRATYLLVKLSISSKQLPSLLYVSNVQLIGNRDPWRSGGFADIFRAKHDGAAVVLKRLRVHCTDKSDSDLDHNFRREALIWRQLRHSFILPLNGIDATTFEETDFLPCLVSPLMRRGTLRDYIRTADYTPLRDFYRLLQEAAQGLAYLHTQKVVHGDIKEVNILISEECHIQLCDFGLVVVGDATDGRLTTTAHANGTRTWMSPQRLMGTRYRRTEADDVYALACLCYYLSTGHAPFHDLSETAALLQVVGAHRPSRPTDGDTCRFLVTDTLWAMVESCWAQDATIRPSAADVVAQLADMAAPSPSPAASPAPVPAPGAALHYTNMPVRFLTLRPNTPDGAYRGDVNARYNAAVAALNATRPPGTRPLPHFQVQFRTDAPEDDSTDEEGERLYKERRLRDYERLYGKAGPDGPRVALEPGANSYA